jgi:16S rRNA (adenine1518-N6/adenine1519-N6)-dimethyltransferase
MLTKTGLIKLWPGMGFRASKKMGQNFLVDANIKDKIVASVAPNKDDIIVEIGPGFGVLTADIAAKCERLIAIEKDRKLAAYLRDSVVKNSGNIELIEGDVLECALPARTTKIVGNLPYYITTPIIEKIIESGLALPVYIMVQDEYARRMVAEPGTKDYSSLSCFVQYHMNVVKMLSVGKKCFFPEPKVDSSFVRLSPKRNDLALSKEDERLFFKIIRLSFQQRRKTLRSSLTAQGVVKAGKEKFASMLESAGISKDVRPEELTLRHFAEITTLIRRQDG